MAKGKLVTAVLGAFVPFVGIVGAIRLAKPKSRWSKRRYKPGSAKLRRSTERFKRIDGIQDRLINAIGGRPSTDADSGAGS